MGNSIVCVMSVWICCGDFSSMEVKSQPFLAAPGEGVYDN